MKIEYETIEEKLIDFCLEEGILRDKLPENEKLEFGYNIEFPQNSPNAKKMGIVRPKDKKFIIIQLGTQISEEHVKALESNPKKNARLIFFEMLKRNLLSKNLMFQIDIKKNRYMISEQIYDDALTMDNLYRYIRKVYSAGYSANILLTDLSGRGLKQQSKNKNNDKSDHFSDDTLYYS